MNLRFTDIRASARRPLALALATALFLTSLILTVSAHAPTPSDPAPEYDHFLLYAGQDGDTVCREATQGERLELQKIQPKDLRQINHIDNIKDNSLSTETHTGTSHLKIILRATANLEANPAAKAAFIRAAAAWENLVTSPVTLYLDADFGSTNFGATWGSGILGATSSPSFNNLNYTVVRNALIAGANTPAKLTVYNSLPSTTIPTDLGSSSNVSVSASIARAIGILNPTAQPSDAAARIGFNSAFTFDFDRSNGISTGQFDFEAVVIHEIGHALGFTSRSGSGLSTPTMWDLYRFRSGTTSATFTNALRIMSIGGPVANSQYYFVPGQNQLGLSDGGPDPDPDPNKRPNNSDGNQSSHWREQNLNGFVYIGIMDPRIPSGLRRDITANDISALNIFGYNSNIVVFNPPPNDNFASAQVISGCSGSVNGTNVGATGESGEPNHSPDNGGGRRSVWYRWLSPGSGSVTVTTSGSGFDTVMSVYTGNVVNSLSVVNQHDDVSASDKTSSITFFAPQGTIYRIAVDGYDNNGSGGDVGPITLNWHASNCDAGPQLQLLLDQSGPAADQAAALDSTLLVRDPFVVINNANLFNPASDRNTRVVVFVSNLMGMPLSSVVVNLVDSNNQSHDIPAQDVRVSPNMDFSQVTFRLPSNLPVRTCKTKVISNGSFSNTATIRIRN